MRAVLFLTLALCGCPNPNKIDTAPPEGDTDADTDADTDTDADADTDSDTDADTDADTDTCPAITLSGRSLVWSGVALGTSEVRELTLGNACEGGADLEVDAAFGADTSAAFSADLSLAPIPPGGSATLAVTFTALDLAVHTGLLELATNDPANPALSVVLSGSASEDQDRDGYISADVGGPDCDDADASVHPGAADTWYDGVDSNCDGADDYDQDADGYPSDDHTGTDCDDTDAAVHPGATDTWYDGVDSDCDGADDNDQDGDGYASSSYGGTDCNDTNAAIHPGATEIWYDGIDQDCNGLTDYDQDGDLYWPTTYGGRDCDDTDATVRPGATETWYDGVDQDCGGGSDYDQDGDGDDSDAYGGTDCDDTDPTVSGLGGETIVDGLDEDCDGLADEGLIPAGGVLVAEMMLDPAITSDANGEWFELTNTTAWDLELFGWEVTADDGDAFTIDSSLPLPAGGRVVLAAVADPAANGGVTPDFVYSRTDFSLANGGDSVFLYLDGDAIFDVSYTSTWDLVAGASLSLDPDLHALAYASLADSWCASTTAFGAGDLGTPGDANDACGAVDHDGDGYSTDDGDCDDLDAAVNPGATETWNGVDDDCDGAIDDVSSADALGWLDGGSNDYLGWAGGLALGDLDGDGGLDLAVGGSYLDSGYSYTGGVYLVDGAGYTTWAGAASGYDFAFVAGGGSYNYFGAMGARLGDQDGDGVDDLLAVGSDAYGYYGDPVAGALFLGGSLSGDYDAGDADVTFEGASGYGTYTRALSDLDVDGDGLDDVVISDAYGYSSGYRGQVSVFSAASLTGAGPYHLYSDADIVLRGTTSMDQLGTVLGGGDLDGDGYGDLLASAPAADQGSSDSGSVYLLLGAGLASSTSVEAVADLHLYGAASGDELGSAGPPQVADLDGDGAADLVVAAPDVGEVYVLFAAAALTGTVSVSAADLTIVGDGPDYLGAGLCTGDLDGDGLPDLILGAPDYDQGTYGSYYANEAGQVVVFDAADLAGSPTLSSQASAQVTAATARTTFGLTLAAGDLSGDGVDELIVAAPSETTNQGRAYVFAR